MGESVFRCRGYKPKSRNAAVRASLAFYAKDFTRGLARIARRYEPAPSMQPRAGRGCALPPASSPGRARPPRRRRRPRERAGLRASFSRSMRHALRHAKAAARYRWIFSGVGGMTAAGVGTGQSASASNSARPPAMSSASTRKPSSFRSANHFRHCEARSP